MSANKTKDILSLLQSRIALRAGFLSEYAPSGAKDCPAVEDQKADKKAVAEIVQLRRKARLSEELVSPYCTQTTRLCGKIREQEALIGKLRRQAQASSLLNT